MDYEPKEWECGDTITANDLNHIENGIADARETVVISFQEEEIPSSSEFPNGGLKMTCNHSWQEIFDALAQGKCVVQVEDISEPEVGSYNVTQVRVWHADGGDGNPYSILFENDDSPLEFPNATDKVIVLHYE